MARHEPYYNSFLSRTYVAGDPHNTCPKRHKNRYFRRARQCSQQRVTRSALPRQLSSIRRSPPRASRRPRSRLISLEVDESGHAPALERWNLCSSFHRLPFLFSAGLFVFYREVQAGRERKAEGPKETQRIKQLQTTIVSVGRGRRNTRANHPEREEKTLAALPCHFSPAAAPVSLAGSRADTAIQGSRLVRP